MRGWDSLYKKDDSLIIIKCVERLCKMNVAMSIEGVRE